MIIEKNCIHEIIYCIVFRVLHQIFLFTKPLFNDHNLTMGSHVYIHCHKWATTKMKCDFTCYIGNMVYCSIYKMMMIDFKLLKNKKLCKIVFWWCWWHNLKNIVAWGQRAQKKVVIWEVFLNWFCTTEVAMSFFYSNFDFKKELLMWNVVMCFTSCFSLIHFTYRISFKTSQTNYRIVNIYTFP